MAVPGTQTESMGATAKPGHGDRVRCRNLAQSRRRPASSRTPQRARDLLPSRDHPTWRPAYLVAMLGERANWVRNVRAAGGRAVLRHGKKEAVRLEEVPVDQRPAILRRYLAVAPAPGPTSQSTETPLSQTFSPWRPESPCSSSTRIHRHSRSSRSAVIFTRDAVGAQTDPPCPDESGIGRSGRRSLTDSAEPDRLATLLLSSPDAHHPIGRKGLEMRGKRARTPQGISAVSASSRRRRRAGGAGGPRQRARSRPRGA